MELDVVKSFNYFFKTFYKHEKNTTAYSRLGNMKIDVVPYKLPLGKRCAAGLTSSNCAIPVILKSLPVSRLDVDDIGDNYYSLKSCSYMKT